MFDLDEASRRFEAAMENVAVCEHSVTGMFDVVVNDVMVMSLRGGEASSMVNNLTYCDAVRRRLLVVDVPSVVLIAEATMMGCLMRQPLPPPLYIYLDYLM